MARSKEEHREYMRAYRARKRAEIAEPARLKLAPPPAAEPAAGCGEVETAVREELAALASAKMPGLAATALAMAKVLDDRGSMPQWPSAASRLQGILASIRAKSEAAPKPRSALEAVRDA